MANTDSELNSLPDGDIELNHSATSTTLTSWSNSVNSFDIDSGTITSTYSALTGIGVLVNTISSLGTTLDDIAKNLKTIISSINISSEDQNKVGSDDSGKNKTYTTGGSSYGGSSGNGGNQETTVEQPEEELEVNTELIKEIKKLDSDQFDLLVVSLLSLVSNKVSLDSLLTNANYASAVKETILANITNEELKKTISNMDATVIQSTLLSMLKNNTTQMVDASTKSIVYKYLETVSNKNNVKLSDLSSNGTLLKTVYKEIANSADELSTLVNSNNSKKFKEIYKGDGLSTNIVKNVVDEYANKNNLKVDDIWDNEKYLNAVKEKLSPYLKSLDYLSLSAYSSSDISKNTINQLLGG